MDILKEVLIKECGNMFHDKVFIVENLPKKFLFEKTARMIPRRDERGQAMGDSVPDPSGEMVDTLYPGIEKSPTGDNGYMFWKGNLESEGRLRDIDNYVERSVPRDSRIPARVDYAQRVGDASSGPLSYDKIPRVTIPLPDMPEEPKPPVEIATQKPVVNEIPIPSSTGSLPPAPAAERLTGERLSQSDRMKKYWEDRKKKESVAA